MGIACKGGPDGAAWCRAAHGSSPGTGVEGMDKHSKEALQVTKELVAKFIETRTVSPGNFAEIFPAVYKVVLTAIRSDTKETE